MQFRRGLSFSSIVGSRAATAKSNAATINKGTKVSPSFIHSFHLGQNHITTIPSGKKKMRRKTVTLEADSDVVFWGVEGSIPLLYPFITAIIKTHNLP